jgi:transcriptional regulator with XRE-family HTH domain
MEISDLARLVLQKRGNMGVRAAAKEIGISPTTLTRIERGNVPDVGTLQKLCEWLGEEPARFTGVGALQIAFKNQKSMPKPTAQALANLIQAASEQFVASKIETKGH